LFNNYLGVRGGLLTDIDDSPLTMMQLLNELKELGFDADFSLTDGLELTIRKRAAAPFRL
jgi:hypothetical protein